MEKARRRRHVPAFGEWNYSYTDEPWAPAAALARCNSAHPAEPDACSDVWFSYSTPQRKPAPKKVRRPADSGGVAPERRHGGKGRRPPRAYEGSVSAAAYPEPEKAARTVRRPVDADLYQVPSPDLDNRPYHYQPPRPRKRGVSSMWKGCLGLNKCVD